MSARWLAVSVALGNLLVPLNSTMIVVALPQVARDLGIALGATSWLVTSYLIAMASLQPIGGGIGDRFGRRRVMLVSLAWFALASVGAAASSSLVVLTFFRLQQAVAAAALVPNGFGVLRDALPGGRRGAEFGIVSAVAGLGATVGPLAGGLLAAVDWRWIFLVNVPVCALALAVAWRVLPERVPRASARFDLVGAVWLGAVLLAASWVLVSWGRGVEPLAIGVGLALVPAAALLVRFESRKANAVLPPALFRVGSFRAACATVALQNFAMYGTLLTLPIALGGPVSSGIALAAFSGGSIVLAPIGGRAADRFGARAPAFAGALLLGAGLAPLAAAVPLPLVLLVISLGIAGVGLGLTFPAMRLAAIESVDGRFAALASGVFSTSRYFGGMLGSILLAVVLTGSSSTRELQVLFMAFAAGAFAAAIPSLSLPAAAPRHDAVGEEIAS